jgi:type II secretory pathway pseudopilin PulG
VNISNRRIQYEGMGFVEALIAISIAGIASVVLLGISVNTLKQIVNNEVSDTLTEKSIQGAEMVRNIGSRTFQTEDDIFPDISENINRCFGFTLVEPATFIKEGDIYINSCNYDNDLNNECHSNGISEDMFRVFCITDQSNPNTGLVVGKVVTGISGCEEEDTKGKCAVADYEYYTIFRTRVTLEEQEE